MRSSNISRTRFLCDLVAEKFLELVEYLSHIFKNRKEWKSNLTESYYIHSKHRGKPFVEDFLRERARILKTNRYKMETIELHDDCDENTIGRVVLYRKKKAVCEATLKTKESDTPDCKLIYWSFK